MQKPMSDAPSCTPCNDPSKAPMAPAVAREKREALPNWTLTEGAKALERNVTFKNWKQAFALVKKLDVLAEAEKHHPDIHFGWGYCSITLTTHNIGGLSENDFIMAAKIETLIGSDA